MEWLFELLLELSGELLLAIFGEAFQTFLPGGDKADPVRASAGFAALGALAGGLSVLFWPRALVRDDLLRFLFFLASPALCALLMYAFAFLRGGRKRRELALRAGLHGLLLSLGYQLSRLIVLALR